MVYPVFIANRLIAQGLPHRVVNRAVIADTLEKAMEAAFQKSGTDKAIVFDGSYGSINLSPAMGRFLMEKAPAVAQKVDAVLMPKWLKQRGLGGTTAR